MSRIFASSYRDPYPDTVLLRERLWIFPLPLKEGYKIRFLEDSGVSFRSLDIDVSVIYVLKFKVYDNFTINDKIIYVLLQFLQFRF